MRFPALLTAIDTARLGAPQTIELHQTVPTETWYKATLAPLAPGDPVTDGVLVITLQSLTEGRRLEALRKLSEAGIPTTVMVAPVIPALNDCEIERILDAAAYAGVREANYVLLRLPLEVRDLFREWLMASYPDRYRHVFALIRDMRNGRDYDSQWGARMKGAGPGTGASR